MTSFERLRDGEGTELERALLDSARDDAPSPDARRRTLAALGLAGGAATALAPSAAHAASAVASGASGGKSAGITALLVAKWLGMGAAVGAVTAVCVATAVSPPAPAPVVDPVAKQAAVEVAAIARPKAAAEAPRAEEATPEAAVATAEPAAPAALPREPVAPEPFPSIPSPAAGGAATTSASRLREEITSLDRARAALAAGNPAAALGRLETHAAEFPAGTLEPEAVVLRVRALRELGRTTEALATARRFLAAHPDSSQAARLRALVGLGPR